MAVATGSQIRPELSAVNYAPYLQATGQAAQMMARGSENIAAGLANLGQQAGAAIKDYYAKQEAKDAENNAVSLIQNKIETNPSLASFLGVRKDQSGAFDIKAIRAAVKTVGVPSILSAAKSLDEEEKLKPSAEYAGLLRTGGGSIPSPMSDSYMSRFTPEQKLSGEERYLRAEKQKADIEGIRAEAKARGVPKVQDLSFQEQAVQQELAALESKLGRKATPQEQAETYAKVAQQSRSTSTVNVGATAAGKIYDDLRLNQNNIRSLREVISNYGEAIDEISKPGAFSGPTGAFKYAGSKVLQLFGNNAFKSQADAYQIAGSSLASAVLSIAKQLPGAASDRDVVFLERVAKGVEQVPDADVLKGIRKRVESKLARSQTAFKRELNAFKAASKEDSTAQLYYNVLSASEEPDTTSGSAQPTLKPFRK